MANIHATSIFEYLTAKNPDLVYVEEKNATQSKNPKWFAPRYVRLWEEFSFETMERVFDGKLMEECRRKRWLPYPVPRLDPRFDCIENGESATVNILMRWTRSIVITALQEVVGTLDPVFWVPRKTDGKSSTSDADAALVDTSSAADAVAVRTGCPSPKSQPRPGPSKRKSLPPRPDGAGISSGRRGISNTNCLPSEIKPGSKWTSEKLAAGLLTDLKGELRLSHKQAGPIVQIYHYCVAAKARYGFLITSKEILVIRIKPMCENPGTSTTGGTEEDPTALYAELENNGLMEYKAIPWGNHNSLVAGQEEGSYRDLTINLFLWILSILAGNNSDPDWDYRPLDEELLRESQPMAAESKSDGDDDGETATEPTQSAVSSFYFSEPGQSFSTSFSRLPEKIQVRTLLCHQTFYIPTICIDSNLIHCLSLDSRPRLLA